MKFDDRSRDLALEAVVDTGFPWSEPLRDDAPLLVTAAVVLTRAGDVEGARRFIHASYDVELRYRRTRSATAGRVTGQLQRTGRPTVDRESPLARETYVRDGFRCYICTRPVLAPSALAFLDAHDVPAWSKRHCHEFPSGTPCGGRRCNSNHWSPAAWVSATPEHRHPHETQIFTACWACQEAKSARPPDQLARIPGWERVGTATPGQGPVAEPWSGMHVST